MQRIRNDLPAIERNRKGVDTPCFDPKWRGPTRRRREAKRRSAELSGKEANRRGTDRSSAQVNCQGFDVSSPVLIRGGGDQPGFV